VRKALLSFFIPAFGLSTPAIRPVTMSAQSSSTDNTSVDRPIFKAKKNQGNASKKRARSDRGEDISLHGSATKQTFFEKLGSDMADGLIKDTKLLGESLNLVDRLAFAKSTTTKTITITTNTTIQEEVFVIPQYTSSSSSTMDSKDSVCSPPKSSRNVFDLNDFAALAALEELIRRYGRVSHMGILDKSYTFFITQDRLAALYYKVANKIAVVGGDPLCAPDRFPQILSEFKEHLKKSGLGIAFLGAGETFVTYVRSQKWITMHFGTERVLNPLTNPVLHGTAAKSITVRNKHLLNPNKEGITIEVYTPRLGKNARLQQQLVNVYDAWRESRNDSGVPQAYITVYDPFALPELMTYIYSKDRSGTPNRFAALRMLGANNGYHLDPCVAFPGAPKGITDLLLYGAMALLNKANISYLSLGYEPLDDLGEITGMSKAIAKISRKVHRCIFQGIHVAGKKDYHDKFRPDEAQQSNLYLIFPPGGPSLRQMMAIVHVANIGIRKVVGKNLREKSRMMFAKQKGHMEDRRTDGNKTPRSGSEEVKRVESPVLQDI
jgi:hypothetical protein